MAYEVIKRVSGRAYRYRVESFRDPVTRGVRGRWTYLGRVDPADAGLPDRPAKLSSRDRLLDAVGRLLETADAEALSAGSTAREAGVAYGTFYRYFTDRAHAVRQALLRNGPTLGDVTTVFGHSVGTAAGERERIAGWLRDAAESARRRRGALRAWHIYSNADEAVRRARTDTVDRAVAALAAHLERLRSAGVSALSSPRFAAYALVALVVTMGRDTALEEPVSAAKVDGIIILAHELCGLSP